MSNEVKFEWAKATRRELCYTCVFHNAESFTPATQARTRTTKRNTINVYFCDKHAAEAKAAEGWAK